MESNRLKIARLRKELNVAEWEGDAALVAALSREIARLEIMLSVGTQYDEPF